MWNQAQRRMLVAMGYTLYARAGSTASVEAMPVAADESPSAAARRAPREEDRLWQALRRAAAGGDVSALIGDLDALRRDPARKRALWPKLRALRRH